VARIAILGMAPLPWEPTLRHFGLGKRTWQFTLPLTQTGHEVVLIAKRMLDAYKDVDDIGDDSPRDHLTIHRLEPSEFHDVDHIRRLIREAEPDCVIGVNMEAASMACTSNPSVPIWADLNGYSMGEAQARHRNIGDQDDPSIMWRQLLPILLRADIFSAVSAPQRFSLIGELGAIGRLNADTFGYEFVHHIPNAVEAPEESSEEELFLSRYDDDPDSFWVYWSGGFNTWADVPTLTHGLNAAMKVLPNLRFISTGGALGVHDPATYDRFQRLVSESNFRDRYHLLGWLPREDAAKVAREAHMGINMDLPCYETQIGARNRINDMLRYGLPVITTFGTEISKFVDRHGLGLVIDCGDDQALANALIWANENRNRLTEMGLRGKEEVLTRFSYGRTTRDVSRWVVTPTFAPDNLIKRAGDRAYGSELERWSHLIREIETLEADRAELHRLHDTRWFRIYDWLRRILPS